MSNKKANIEKKDFPDISANQGNNDNPMIVINKATKGTSEEIIEVSDLEVSQTRLIRPDKKNYDEEPIKL